MVAREKTGQGLCERGLPSKKLEVTLEPTTHYSNRTRACEKGQRLPTPALLSEILRVKLVTNILSYSAKISA